MLFKQLVLAPGGFLAGVPVGRRILGGQGSRLVGLKLDGLRAAFGGFVNEPAGNVHAALMVHPGFGNHIGDGNTHFGGRNSKYIHEFHAHFLTGEF